MADISIWTTSQTPSTQDYKLTAGSRISARVVSLAAEDLGQNLKTFLESFQEAFNSLPQKVGDFRLEQVELNLVTNASGGIELVGKLDVGAEASITVVLKR
jgi:hypothetical protein